MYEGSGGTTDHPWEISPEAEGIPLAELEAFFQRWLFFGLLVEALGGNAEEGEGEEGRENEEMEVVGVSKGPNQEIIDRIYKSYTIQTSSGTYLTTKYLHSDLQTSWSISLPSFQPSRNQLATRFPRLRLCLRRAWYFHTHLPPNFSPQLKFAIGAVGETIAHAMSPVRFYLNLEGLVPTEWGNGFLDWEEVVDRMVGKGWCRSDLEVLKHRFKYLTTWHYLSYLERAGRRRHEICTREECVVDDITVDKRIREHWVEGCDCGMVGVDMGDVMDALRVEKGVPLLRLKKGLEAGKSREDSLEGSSKGKSGDVEVVRSTRFTPYIAISHVSSQSAPGQKPLTMHRSGPTVSRTRSPTRSTSASSEKCGEWLKHFLLQPSHQPPTTLAPQIPMMNAH